MTFALRGRTKEKLFKATMQINTTSGGNEIFIQHERLGIKNQSEIVRDATGTVIFHDGKLPPLARDVRCPTDSLSSREPWMILLPSGNSFR